MRRLFESASTATLRQLLRARLWVAERLRPGDQHYLLAMAALIGVAGAIASHLFRRATVLVHLLLTGDSDGFVDSFARLAWWQRVLVPAAGGALAGCVLHFGARVRGGPKSSDYMEAIVVGDGRVSFRKGVVKCVSALFSVASGASIGREGPLVQLSAMIASLPERWFRLSLPKRRQLVACGAAAGIASAYNAPIAGALFVAEIVLGSLSMETFGPMVVASVVATLVTRVFQGEGALYATRSFVMGSAWEIAPYALLGIACGIAAPLYLRFLRLSEAAFQRLPVHRIARMTLGGAVVGALAIVRPEVCGNGYSVVASILHSSWTAQALVAVLLLKVVATGATFGSGAVGGVFTPTLLTGGALGYLFGIGAAGLAIFAGLSPNASALVGMGGFLAAATGAPVMAILMVFELTLDYQIILPLMLACVLGYATSHAFETRFLYGESIERKKSARVEERLKSARAGDLMRPRPVRVGRNAAFREIAQTFLQHRYNHLYVVDDDQRFLGAVALHDIKAYLDQPELAQLVIAQEIQHEDFPWVTADTPLEQALARFQNASSERLPVLDDDEHRRLVGTLSKNDLLTHLMGQVRGE